VSCTGSGRTQQLSRSPTQEPVEVRVQASQSYGPSEVKRTSSSRYRGVVIEQRIRIQQSTREEAARTATAVAQAAEKAIQTGAVWEVVIELGADELTVTSADGCQLPKVHLLGQQRQNRPAGGSSLVYTYAALARWDAQGDTLQLRPSADADWLMLVTPEAAAVSEAVGLHVQGETHYVEERTLQATRTRPYHPRVAELLALVCTHHPLAVAEPPAAARLGGTRWKNLEEDVLGPAGADGVQQHRSHGPPSQVGSQAGPPA
jgi:hypothetical protein